MKKEGLLFFLCCLLVIPNCVSQNHNTPPVLVVVPRTIQIALDTKVDTVVARIKATDDADEVTFSITPNALVVQGLLPFKDGAPYFKIIKVTHSQLNNKSNSTASEGLIVLAASLDGKFKVGDQMTFSITGDDTSSGIITRTEVPVFIEEPINHNSDDETNSSTSSTTLITTTTATAETTTKSDPTTKATTTTLPVTASTAQHVNVTQDSGSVEGMVQNEDTKERSEFYVAILVPVFVVGPAIIGFIIFLMLRRRQGKDLCCFGRDRQDKDITKIETSESFRLHRDQRKVTSNSYGFTPKSGEINSVPILADEDRWEFPRHQLKILGMLGEGCFGQVWKCEAENIDGTKGTKIVALKTLKESASEKEKKDLLHELAVMKMLEPHPNVVRLIGCCTDKDPIFVIIEYIAGGTLQDFLRKSRSEHNYKNLHGESQTLSARDLTSFAYQIAKGMAYLSSKKVIHRDLAARNVLVTSDDPIGKSNGCFCKVADFGFARDVMANNIYERKSEGRLPIRWMAPESLYDNCYTTKSDVWSFGVLLWEIVTLGSTPYPGLSASEVMKRVRDGVRLEKPEHCKREIYNIMYYCWDKNPEDRPSFSSLVQEFESLLVKETDYIDLNMFPEHEYYNEISLSGEKV